MHRNSNDNQELFDDLHKKGHIALHVTNRPRILVEKLDDKRILNNLREDGGTTDRERDDYQLYTIISSTILPPNEFKIEQRLYDNGFTLMGLNIENSQIKDFAAVDAAAHYGFTNKKGRPTYKGTLFGSESQVNLMQTIDEYNTTSCYNVTHKTGDEDDIFGFSEPNFIRPMNEALIKINSESLLFIGCSAAHIANQPELLFHLMLLQHKLHEDTGIEYPIMILNNRLNSIKLNFVADSTISINANQFHQLNVTECLNKLFKGFPNGITIREKVRNYYNYKDNLLDRNNMIEMAQLLGYKFQDNKLTKISHFNLHQQHKTTLNEINKILKQLENILPNYKNSDGIVQIHKLNNSNANISDKYLEINQDKLEKFILDRIMHVPKQNLSDLDAEKLKTVIKAYNLQFRLQTYEEILNSSTNANYVNINKDINWFRTLKNPLIEIFNTSNQPMLKH